MADELVNKSLELFASGDLAGAARLWLQARQAGSTDPQIEAYLQHLAAIAPDTLASMEKELGAAPAAEPEPTTPVDRSTTSWRRSRES